MSAYIVDDSQINAILNFVANKAMRPADAFSYRFYQKNVSNSPVVYSNDELLQMYGQELVNFNYKSVNERYRNEYGEPHKFEFKRDRKSVSLVQFLKYLNSLDYQCCEPEDYFKSEESGFWYINALKDFGIKQMDGYNAAEW